MSNPYKEVRAVVTDEACMVGDVLSLAAVNKVVRFTAANASILIPLGIVIPNSKGKTAFIPGELVAITLYGEIELGDPDKDPPPSFRVGDGRTTIQPPRPKTFAEVWAKAKDPNGILQTEWRRMKQAWADMVVKAGKKNGNG